MGMNGLSLWIWVYICLYMSSHWWSVQGTPCLVLNITLGSILRSLMDEFFFHLADCAHFLTSLLTWTCSSAVQLSRKMHPDVRTGLIPSMFPPKLQYFLLTAADMSSVWLSLWGLAFPHVFHTLMELVSRVGWIIWAGIADEFTLTYGSAVFLHRQHRNSFMVVAAVKRRSGFRMSRCQLWCDALLG